MDYYKEFPARYKDLEQLIKDKNKSLVRAPQGSLHVKKRGNTVQYYVRYGSSDEKYLRRKQYSFARTLAQKEYDIRVIKAAEKELKGIKMLLNSIPEIKAEDVYKKMSVEKRKLIQPFMLPDEEFIESWMSVNYQGKEFRNDFPEFYTSTGIRVRSKSEILIADMLNKLHVPYKYECPLLLQGLGTIFPDFTILNVHHRKEMYLEHLGMMDDQAYAEGALQRILLYEQNGIYPGKQLILLHETSSHPLNTKEMEKLLISYLL